METQYEAFEQLGRNHYSVVFNGRDMTIGRDVAIMELHQKFRNDASRWPAIWSQVRGLINAKLENVVPVFGAVESSGWIVMEKMRGNLKHEIAKRPLPPVVVRSVLRQALEALQSYHRHGVLHGDVKPANLLFNNEGYVKLSFSPGLQLGGQIPQREHDFKYLAPELLNQQLGGIEPALDLYCLGFCAVEMLMGSEFDGLFKGVGTQAIDADAAWMRWHSTATEALPRVDTLVPGCPEDVTRVIDRLLKKRVAERYRSADEALADLAEGPHERVAVSETPPVVVPPVKTVSNDMAVKTSGPNKMAPTPARTPAPATSAQQLKPFSRQWINKKLEDPKILYSVCALILLPVLAFLFYPDSAPSVNVQISWTPNDANVKLDNQDFQAKSGSTVPLQSGNHSILIEKEGFETLKEDFAVSAKSPQEHRFTLKKFASTVEVELEWNPAGAVATLDDLELKQPSGSSFPLKPGTHSIELTLEGYETYKGTFEISGDHKRIPPFTMTAKTPPASALITPPTTSLLPEGLEPATESGIDEMLKLPLNAVSTRLKNSVYPAEFILVSPGKFTFGAISPQVSELMAKQDEVVELAFYVGKTEVTNEQFIAYAADAKRPDDLPSLVHAKERAAAGAEREPVLAVPYAEALLFCQWISKSGDLPSEREWEKAARGTEGREFPWGNDSSILTEMAWLRVDGTKAVPCNVDEHTSGQTPEGVFHMLGNAAELCKDVYAAGQDDIENGFPGIDSNHVIRGASFRMLPTDAIRLTWRANVDDAGDMDVGFRPVIRTKVQESRPVK
jgi:serine/threonine-protein kinase